MTLKRKPRAEARELVRAKTLSPTTSRIPMVPETTMAPESSG